MKNQIPLLIQGRIKFYLERDKLAAYIDDLLDDSDFLPYGIIIWSNYYKEGIIGSLKDAVEEFEDILINKMRIYPDEDKLLDDLDNYNQPIKNIENQYLEDICLSIRGHIYGVFNKESEDDPYPLKPYKEVHQILMESIKSILIYQSNR